MKKASNQGKKQKISEIYALASGNRPVFSFEVFPPKHQAGSEKLHETLKELKQKEADFVSITCGTGGSIREKTLEWSREAAACGHTVMPHYTCLGINRKHVLDDIREIKRLGIYNLMIIRGDHPSRAGAQPLPQGDFRHASHLIEYIHNEDRDFSIGGACYPELHPESSSMEEDLLHLRSKVESGADFLVTQLFFRNECYFHFLKNCRSHDITLPIIPGIMPISNFRQIEKFTQMANCSFPASLLKDLEQCGTDELRFQEVSFIFSLKQCRELLEQGAPGIHFYTLNQSRIPVEILNELATSSSYSPRPKPS